MDTTCSIKYCDETMEKISNLFKYMRIQSKR